MKKVNNKKQMFIPNSGEVLLERELINKISKLVPVVDDGITRSTTTITFETALDPTMVDNPVILAVKKAGGEYFFRDHTAFFKAKRPRTVSLAMQGFLWCVSSLLVYFLLSSSKATVELFFSTDDSRDNF